MIWFATWILGHGLSRSSNLGQLRTANPPKNNIKSAKDLLLVKSVWPKKKKWQKKKLSMWPGPRSSGKAWGTWNPAGRELFGHEP